MVVVADDVFFGALIKKWKGRQTENWVMTHTTTIGTYSMYSIYVRMRSYSTRPSTTKILAGKGYLSLYILYERIRDEEKKMQGENGVHSITAALELFVRYTVVLYCLRAVSFTPQHLIL